jgi:HD-GYP domain-containing protein (c-di-GMP phosphodiesterase class II)
MKVAVRPSYNHKAGKLGGGAEDRARSQALGLDETLGALSDHPHVLFIMRGDRLTFLSSAFESLTGVSAAKLLGESLWDYLSPGARELARAGEIEDTLLHVGPQAMRVRVSFQKGSGPGITVGSLEAVSPLAERVLALEGQVREWQLAVDSLAMTLGRAWSNADRHGDRVTGYALRLGACTGLSEDELVALRWAAMLHDVGKLRIPDSVLNKSGPLDPDERSLMEQHPRLGLEIVQDIVFLPGASRDAILYHHERINGTGYPFRLRGSEIPILAQITGIVDVFDALTSDRCYKSAWGLPESIEYLLESRDTLFDAQLIDTFVDKVLNSA